MVVRHLDLEALQLASGSHQADEREMCVMEAVAYVAGEPWSDHPQCASPVIAAFCRTWNDTPESYGQAIRDRLRAYIPRLVGSRGTSEVEDRRGWLAVDWLIRVHAPAWLRLAGLGEHADTLAALPPQTGLEAVQSSAAAWDAARAAAWAAAWAAARDAARDAAWDAAWAAAWAARDAAWAAARAAAWAAAWAAARDARAAARAAAWAAAWAARAARAALRPTVDLLQESAWGLLDAMLACE
jgi:hypothetical protein